MFRDDTFRRPFHLKIAIEFLKNQAKNQSANAVPDPVIVLETDRFLAVCKPGGLLTQAPSGIDSMETRVKQYLARVNEISGKVYLGVPHRLDRPASGVMVFAKDKKAARFLAEQFQRREVRKIYWALSEGTPNSEADNESGRWEDWMRKVPDEARSEICEEGDAGAQSAILDFRVAGKSDVGTLLEIRLLTGRSHQIRLQSGSRGHALLGDVLYGSQLKFGPQTEDQRLRWIALHARELTVVDPGTKQPVTLVGQLPEYWPENLRKDS